MSGTGTKILVLALILSFSFRLWAGTKIAGIDAGSVTYEDAETQIDFLGSYVGSIQEVISNNLATSAVSAIGIVFGNPYLAFAGIALTLFNTFVFPQALLNEAIIPGIGITGTLLSNIISLLFGLAILSWFAQRGDF